MTMTMTMIVNASVVATKIDSTHNPAYDDSWYSPNALYQYVVYDHSIYFLPIYLVPLSLSLCFF